MYRKEKPLPLKSSASLLCNNLTVLSNGEKGSLNYAVIHKYLINMVCTSTDGTQITHKQVVCKEPSATQHGSSMIIQTKWVVLPCGRSVLVLTSLNGIQMFEYDGSAMLFWYALAESPSPETADQSNFGRGITGLSDNLICVGTQQGRILVFNIPPKGTNVALVDTLKVHKSAISDLASEGKLLVSSDDEGNIITWKFDQSISQINKIAGNGDPCSSLALWKGVIVGAFGSGQIRLFDSSTGRLGACVNAHARWINALDIAKTSGLVVSASEDTYVRVWQLVPGPSPSIKFKYGESASDLQLVGAQSHNVVINFTVLQIEFKYGESVTDLQLVGAQFIHDAGKGFCVTGYDSSDMIFFVGS